MLYINNQIQHDYRKGKTSFWSVSKHHISLYRHDWKRTYPLWSFFFCHFGPSSLKKIQKFLTKSLKCSYFLLFYFHYNCASCYECKFWLDVHLIRWNMNFYAILVILNVKMEILESKIVHLDSIMAKKSNQNPPKNENGIISSMHFFGWLAA